MSGSPLLVKNPEGYFVIGLLHGGPASTFHYPIAKAVNSYRNPATLDSLCDIATDFKKKCKRRAIHCPVRVRNLIVDLKKNWYSINELYGLLDDHYTNSLAIEASIGTKINYNVCISATIFSIEVGTYISR